MDMAQRRTKFYDALVKIYYPREPTPPDKVQEDVTAELVYEYRDVSFFPDVDEMEEEDSSVDTSESVPQKLTRAQRKRIRRKKLKDAALSRRKIIGPLLPDCHEDYQSSHLKKEEKVAEDAVVVAAVASINAP